MKRIISLLLVCVLTLACITPCFAGEDDAPGTQYFDDGSYCVTNIYYVQFIKPDDTWTAEEDEVNDPGFIISLMRLFKRIFALLKKLSGVKEISHAKEVRYYDSKNVLLWTVTLTASFEYNGSSAVCTGAWLAFDPNDTDWKIDSSSCIKEENRAVGAFSVRQYKLGAPLKLIEKEITLTCSPNGEIT
ncbi:MAG: hypothetical protein K6G90_12255 [Clostridia bacterium]|nr:hypothetical protein [Clostridia bacterium]